MTTEPRDLVIDLLRRMQGDVAELREGQRANLAEAMALLESFGTDEPPREGDELDEAFVALASVLGAVAPTCVDIVDVSVPAAPVLTRVPGCQ